MAECRKCHSVLPSRTDKNSRGNTKYCLSCRQVEIICAHCGTARTISRAIYDYELRENPQKEFFCSSRCSTIRNPRRTGATSHNNKKFKENSFIPIEYDPLVLSTYQEEVSDVRLYQKVYREIGWEWAIWQPYMDPGEVIQCLRK